MQTYQHITPPLRLYCGPESLDHLGRELQRLQATRAVVVCGPWAHGPMLSAVQKAMGDRCVGVYAGVAAHSPIATVEEASRELVRHRADAVVALGGGSSIVTARAATILAAEGAHIRELCTTRGSDGRLHSPKLQAAKLPQLIVPTTPTTAMVKAGSAVFMPETSERLALYDPKTRAQSVFIHPEFVLSAPRDLVVSATLNTLSLAIEGLVSRAGDPMSDALLMHVIRLSLARLMDPGLASDAGARADLVVAAIMCGQGTDHTAAGITTVLGHAIGARHGVENGVLNGIVLPHALRFNGLLAEPGLRKVAAAMGIEASGGEALLQAVIDRICACLGGLGAIQRLRDVGVLRDALPALADSGMSDWFLTGNPRRVEHASELQQVLEAAW